MTLCSERCHTATPLPFKFPSPLGEGIGARSVSLYTHNIFPILQLSLLYITDPTPTPPLQGRGVISNGGK